MKFTDEQLRELEDRLKADRMEISLRGHDWDVADVMAVLRKYLIELSTPTS